MIRLVSRYRIGRHKRQHRKHIFFFRPLVVSAFRIRRFFTAPVMRKGVRFCSFALLLSYLQTSLHQLLTEMFNISTFNRGKTRYSSCAARTCAVFRKSKAHTCPTPRGFFFAVVTMFLLHSRFSEKTKRRSNTSRPRANTNLRYSGTF